MATVTVEIDLSEIKINDLVHELKGRVSEVNDRELRKIRNAACEIDTLDKEMKLEEFLENLKK